MTKMATAWAFATGWLIAALLGTTAQARPSSVGGTELEARELAAASPEAASLITKAEALARAGASKQAWDLYAQAWSLAPRSPLPARGMCRMVLDLGIQTAEQRRSARETCHRALLLGATPEAMRDEVAALIAGDPPPSMDDLVAASLAAEGAVRTGGLEQPWGHAARGDLALRLGDRELLDLALTQLKQVAPGHPETLRLAALASPAPSRVTRLGRLLVIVLLFFTLAHAVRDRLRRSRKTGVAALTVLTAFTVLFFAGPAEAAAGPAAARAVAPDTPPPLPPIDDAHPERSVPTPAQQMANPLRFGDLLMELGVRADAAAKRQDHAAAARYYAALAKAVPDRSYAYSKLCDELEAGGHRAEAIDACGTALTRHGATAGDFTRFVRLLLAKNGPLTGSERRQADTAVAALEREPRAALIATRLRCNIAVHEREVAALERCVNQLQAAEPDAASTLGFAWALAVEHGDRRAAETLRQRALAAGLDASVVATARPIPPGPRARRWARALRWGLEAVVLFAVAVMGALAVRRLSRAGRRGLAFRRGES